METSKYERAKAAILAVVHEAAPEHLAAFKWAWFQTEDAWRESAARPEARKFMLAVMVGMLLDGLRYGNWPREP